MKEFCKKDIEFQFMKLRSNCEKMIEVMKACHQEVEVTDMTNISVSQSSSRSRRAMPERAMASRGAAMLDGAAYIPDRALRSERLEMLDACMEDGMMLERGASLEGSMAKSSKMSAVSLSYEKKAAPKKSLMSMFSFSKKKAAAPVERAVMKESKMMAMAMPEMMDDGCADEESMGMDMMAMPKSMAMGSSYSKAAEEPKDVFLEEFVKGTSKQVRKRQAAARSKKAAF